MCDFLGVIKKGRKVRTFNKQPCWDATKFVPKKYRQLKHWDVSPFEKNPLRFVESVLSIRRKGRDWSRSTLSKLCGGVDPSDDEFEVGD